MKKGGKELGILIILVVLVGASFFVNHNVLSLANLQNTSRLIGIYGVMSIGMAFVIITGGIDLSIGSVLAFMGVIFSMILANEKIPPIIAVVATIAGACLLGWGHGALVTRVRMQPFVVTLCGLLLYRGLARFVSHDHTAGFADSKPTAWIRNLAVGDSFGIIPNPVVIMVVLGIAAYILLHKSVYGRYLFASGYNEESSRYAGIDSKKIITTAYVICGFTAGLATILFAYYSNSISPSSHGSFYELYAIAAAVLGGCSLRGGEGSIIGVALGITLLIVLRNLINILGIASELEFAVMGTVIFIGVLLDTTFRSKGSRTT